MSITLCVLDINECEDPDKNPCLTIPNARCNNLVGSHECVCNDGYAPDKENICRRKSSSVKELFSGAV